MSTFETATIVKASIEDTPYGGYVLVISLDIDSDGSRVVDWIKIPKYDQFLISIGMDAPPVQFSAGQKVSVMLGVHESNNKPYRVVKSYRKLSDG